MPPDCGRSREVSQTQRVVQIQLQEVGQFLHCSHTDKCNESSNGVSFFDAFPINVSSIEFDSSADVEYFVATATFRYVNYEIKPIDN